VEGLCRTYGDLPPGHPVVLFGSTGHIEIAVNAGNAAEKRRLAKKLAIEVSLDE